jgi:hypothetical protein
MNDLNRSRNLAVRRRAACRLGMFLTNPISGTQQFFRLSQ